MKRLLFLAHRTPYPPDKGERLRAYHQIKALAERFRVTVAALAHDEADLAAGAALGELCESVHLVRTHRPAALARGARSLLAGRSITEGFFRNRSLLRRCRAEAAAEPFAVAMGYCSGMLDTLLAVPAGGRVLDLVDVDSAKWAAYAADGGAKGLLYRLEAARVGRLERRAVRECGAVLLVSEAEAAALGAGGRAVHAVGNGVDLDYFAPAPPAAADPPTIAFTGTMDYRPNIEGVCWFVEHVWPRIRRAAPTAVFNIVGRNPARAVGDLAGDGVVVTGAVPDVRPYLAGAVAVVAPLRIARGVQNKVLEAMAAGRAVAASPAAREGLDVRPGSELLIADTPEQWADVLLGLFASPERAAAIGARARAAVEHRYSWPARLAPLVELCERLAAD